MSESGRKRLLIYSRGQQDSGGSGFETLVQNTHTNPAILANTDIVGVVSSIPDGNVFRIAKRLGIPFECLSGSYEASDYQALSSFFRADHVHLSGWLQMVRGLDPKTTTNIHPGKLVGFGGKKFYGHHVHEAVFAAYLRGEITQSAVCMHFATEIYDDPRTMFFSYPIALPQPIDYSLTPDKIGSMVNQVERAWQSYMLSMVLNGYIHLHTWQDEKGVTQYKVCLMDHAPKKLFF